MKFDSDLDSSFETEGKILKKIVSNLILDGKRSISEKYVLKILFSLKKERLRIKKIEQFKMEKEEQLKVKKNSLEMKKIRESKKFFYASIFKNFVVKIKPELGLSFYRKKRFKTYIPFLLTREKGMKLGIKWFSFGLRFFKNIKSKSFGKYWIYKMEEALTENKGYFLKKLYRYNKNCMYYYGISGYLMKKLKRYYT